MGEGVVGLEVFDHEKNLWDPGMVEEGEVHSDVTGVGVEVVESGVEGVGVPALKVVQAVEVVEQSAPMTLSGSHLKDLMEVYWVEVGEVVVNQVKGLVYQV